MIVSTVSAIMLINVLCVETNPAFEYFFKTIGRNTAEYPSNVPMTAVGIHVMLFVAIPHTTSNNITPIADEAR